MKECSWFENWFDSKYYHILYGNRDESEAELFLNNLLHKLKPGPGARIHDLCCGRGRYAVLLNKHGFDVIGSDLSAESIQYASRYSNKTLSFLVSDMRQTSHFAYFDYVFNLFTSFGYFASDAEHEQVIQAVHKSLKQGGIFILDYMNAVKTIPNLKPFDTREAQGIHFEIKKSLAQGYIVKDIRFTDKGKNFHFTERVRAYSHPDFERMLTSNGFELMEVWGDYALNPFNPDKSDRLILMARKN
ncbi:MAG: class I SAM-dependent DNA methyltransferase [Bacteroidia bacterium]